MKWYKRDPHRYVEGTRELSLEERGFYNDLIELYAARNGNLLDDDYVLAKLTNVHWRTARHLKIELFKAGKVASDGVRIIPNGSQETLKEASEYIQEQSKRAKKRWENNETADAVAMPPQPQPQPHKKERETARKRAPLSPLPENFLPSDLSDSNRGEFEKFKSYHLAKGSRFSNWFQAWRNWQLKAAEFKSGKTGPPSTAPTAAEVAAARAKLERAGFAGGIRTAFMRERDGTNSIQTNGSASVLEAGTSGECVGAIGLAAISGHGRSGSEGQH